MTIRFDALLSHWHPRRNHVDWVLATIVETNLSTYRKAGAMMLMNSLGESYGMLSGGCLEGDLLAQARRVLMIGKSIRVDYDLREDSDSLWQKGLGCGGSVSILLQAVNERNAYLGLEQIHTLLSAQQHLVYHQRVDKLGLDPTQWEVKPAEAETLTFFQSARSRTVHTDCGGTWLQTLLSPAPRLLIFGGGRDAQPLSSIAHTLGWKVTVVDERHGYASSTHFPHAHIVRHSPDDLANDQYPVDAIVIMTHNITLDAQALKFAQRSSAKYIGLLGPEHRRERVERAAGLSKADFSVFYCGPAGLDIGAKLPETIALAILGQCHQVVEGQQQNAAEQPSIDVERCT